MGVVAVVGGRGPFGVSEVRSWESQGNRALSLGQSQGAVLSCSAIAQKYITCRQINGAVSFFGGIGGVSGGSHQRDPL